MASSSSGGDFFGNCSQCSKMDLKLYHCPALAGRSHPHYANISGLPMPPQVLSRSQNQSCPATHQPIYPYFPVRVNSICNCSRCRSTNVDRQMAMNSHMAVNSCWVNPMEVCNTSINTNFAPNPIHSQPCIPSTHIGMASIAPMDGLPISGMPALSYHHHRHFHHYHYHNQAQSRNHIHPYALPVFHPRLRRQAGRAMRHSDENPMPPNFIPILTSQPGTWEGRLESENVVNIRELIDDEKPKGVSKCVLENLPTYRVKSKEKHVGELRCVVCLMDFELKQQVRVLPCSHEYHSKCIDKWLKSNRSCPICRKEIKIG